MIKLICTGNLYSILLLLFLCSCQGRFVVSGVVIDKASGKPLDRVEVTALDEVHTKGINMASVFTATDGRFKLSYPEQEIKEKVKLPFLFQKEGYGSVTEFFPRESGGDTIFLVRYF
jgi:5-hydroxyisourate hydrolase-like protein (transthyretin family)